MCGADWDSGAGVVYQVAGVEDGCVCLVDRFVDGELGGGGGLG